MNFQEAVKNYMKIRKIKGKILAERCSVSPQYITDIRNGRRSPTFQLLNLMLDAMNLMESEKNELLELWKKSKDESYSTARVCSPDTLILSLPVVGCASAGPGKLNFEDPERQLEILVTHRESYAKCFVMDVDGDSMEPRIRDGSQIIVDTTQTEAATSINKIIVANLNDEAYVKVLRLTKNRLILESINESYESIPIRGSDTFNIVGRVIEIRYREILS